MQNGELNFRHFVTPEISVLAGFRYVNWHETLGTSFDPVNPFAGIVLPPGAVVQYYHTSNFLFGFQVGGEWKTALSDRFGLDFGGKAGVFGAQSEMDANLFVLLAAGQAPAAPPTRTSFVGDLSALSVPTALTHRHQAPCRLSGDVARRPGPAPSTINAATNCVFFSSVNNRGSVFLHVVALVGLDSLLVFVTFFFFFFFFFLFCVFGVFFFFFFCFVFVFFVFFFFFVFFCFFFCFFFFFFFFFFLCLSVAFRPRTRSRKPPDHGRVLAWLGRLSAQAERHDESWPIRRTTSSAAKSSALGKDKARSASATTRNTCASPGAWVGKPIVFTADKNMGPSVEGEMLFATKPGPGWAKDGQWDDPREGKEGPLRRDWAAGTRGCTCTAIRWCCPTRWGIWMCWRCQMSSREEWSVNADEDL